MGDEGTEDDAAIDADPPLPPALADAFAASPEAHARWRRLRRGDRWFQIGPIMEAKKPETKARRAQAIVDWLLHEIDDTSVPPELEAVLAADPEARTLFEALPKRDRVDWCQMVRAAKKPETRVRRAEQLPDRLRAKVAEKQRRKAEGTDDLGGRFGQLVIDVVGADLRAAGYRPRQKGRHWRRVRGDRADLIGFYTFRGASAERVQLRLEGGTYLAILDEVTGEGSFDPARVPTEAGMGPTDWPREALFVVTPTADEADLRAGIRATVRQAMTAIDSLGDLSDPAALVAACREHWPRMVPAALVAAGPSEEARRAVLERAQWTAERGMDPRSVAAIVALAGRCGLTLDDLPSPQAPPEPEPTEELVARLHEEVGDVITRCTVGDDGRIHLQVLQPTEEQMATVRRNSTRFSRVEVVRHSLEEQTEVLRRLRAVLLQRERDREDLVAHPASWRIGEITVEVANLDDETDEIMRAIVPDDLLTVDGFRSPGVLLAEKAERLRRPPDPAEEARITDITALAARRPTSG